MRKPKRTALKAARLLKGWSQRDAADGCGINPGTFHRIEQGDLGVSPVMARTIARKFGLPVKALFSPSWYAAHEEVVELEALAS